MIIEFIRLLLVCGGTVYLTYLHDGHLLTKLVCIGLLICYGWLFIEKVWQQDTKESNENLLTMYSEDFWKALDEIQELQDEYDELYAVAVELGHKGGKHIHRYTFLD